MLITKRLDESDQGGAAPHHLPADLDDEGWVQRLERISRFVMEVSAARTRIQHVGQLNERKNCRSSPGRNGHRFPLDADQVQAGAGQGGSRNGRLGSEARRFEFP